MNELFVLIRSISVDTEGVEMKKASKNTGLSLKVAGNLDISNFIDDFYRVVRLYDVVKDLKSS